MSDESNVPGEPKTEPEVPAYEKDEFKQRVIAAGFPGSLQTDSGFLAALYRFGKGQSQEQTSEGQSQSQS